jgi:hypothetical protein
VLRQQAERCEVPQGHQSGDALGGPVACIAGVCVGGVHTAGGAPATGTATPWCLSGGTSGGDFAQAALVGCSWKAAQVLLVGPCQQCSLARRCLGTLACSGADARYPVE